MKEILLIAALITTIGTLFIGKMHITETPRFNLPDTHINITE